MISIDLNDSKKIFRHIKKLVTILSIVLILPQCSSGTSDQPAPVTEDLLQPGDYVVSFEYDGVSRQYTAHVPAGYSGRGRIPTVIMFHGGGGTAQGAIDQTGWVDKSDLEGFLIVFPEGTRPDPDNPASFAGNPQTWNDGSGRLVIGAVERNVDDIGFASELINDLIGRFKADQARIYVTGFSNGAAMTFRLGRELALRIAAIAPVAGSDWSDDLTIGRPVPLLYITGTADPLNPIDGGEIFIGATSYGIKPAVDEMIQKWITLINCPAISTVIYDFDGVLGLRNSPCDQGSEVILYTVEDLGHVWPGGISHLPEIIVGLPSDKLMANDVIWEFFQNHSL